MKFILGINAFHGDSSAALLIDGRLVAAAEEERFLRIKHWAGLPLQSIRYCLQEAEITLEQLDAIAINQDMKVNLWKKIAFSLTNRPDLKLILERIKNKRERESIKSEIVNAFPNEHFNGKVYAVEHHLAHLYSAFYVSPFENAVTVSVDGFGDFSSGAWGVGRDRNINIDGRVFFPHSLGIFYQAMTQYLGFPNYGDEYKVMGLAPYGRPQYLDEMRQIVHLKKDGSYRLNLGYFRHHKEKIAYEWENGQPVFGSLFSEKISELLGPVRGKDEEFTQKHFDIAYSIQAMYEESFFYLLNKLHQKYMLDAITLAGGCAMNSVANGKITRNTPFKDVYVQPAAGDAGGAIGAAFSVWNDFHLNKLSSKVSSDLKDITNRFVMDHAYWGPSFTNEVISQMLAGKRDELQKKGCLVSLIENEEELCRRAAKGIADGKVIGWFQGRMEWGPRALGNRSIVCDPRRADMKDILNIKIKRRESFRPFAPSILRERVSEWFEQEDDVPFMMKVFQIKEEKRNIIPAVTHVDGSGRLQTVCKKTNRRYYRLIEAFRDITNIPLILNTSFNENEPIVNTPEQAYACFARTKMDMLVMENYIVERCL